MTEAEFNEVPFHEKIVENGDIRCPSVFIFESKSDIGRFFTALEFKNCACLFENEQIDFPKDKRGHLEMRLLADLFLMERDQRGFSSALVKFDNGEIEIGKWD